MSSGPRRQPSVPAGRERRENLWCIISPNRMMKPHRMVFDAETLPGPALSRKGAGAWVVARSSWFWRSRVLLGSGSRDVSEPAGRPALSPAAQERPVKALILAGQSNREGHGQIPSLHHLGNPPKYGHLLKLLKNADGSWVVRHDVTISHRVQILSERKYLHLLDLRCHLTKALANGPPVHYPLRATRWNLRLAMVTYLAYCLDQEFWKAIEYLKEQVRVLKEQQEKDKRILLDNLQRTRLATHAKRLTRELLEATTVLFTPETVLGWYRRLIAQKYDGSKNRKTPGRPRISQEVIDRKRPAEYAHESRTNMTQRIGGTSRQPRREQRHPPGQIGLENAG